MTFPNDEETFSVEENLTSVLAELYQAQYQAERNLLGAIAQVKTQQALINQLIREQLVLRDRIAKLERRLDNATTE